MTINSELTDLISYINDNLRFGSKIKQYDVDNWFKKYSLKIEEKLLVYDELDSLKIGIVDHPRAPLEACIFKFYKCIGNQSEIKKSVLSEWFKKNNINESIQQNFLEELKKNNYTIVSDTFQIRNQEMEFDFLDDLADDDLDSLLDDEAFIEKVDTLEDVVDKSHNIDYLIQLGENDEIKRVKALKNLVSANDRLVWKVVDRYFSLATIGFDENDMYQIGMIGLMKATEKFDVSLGYEFSTYAMWWIRQSITRGIADYSTLIRIPVHYREKMTKFIRVENNLWDLLARPATENEIAKEMDISLDEIDEIKFYIEQSNLDSLDREVGESGDTKLGDLLSDNHSPTPEMLLIDSDRYSVIDKALYTRLTDREQQVIQFRFGLLDGSEGMTLEEIGALFNVTRERIRQIEARAILRLRDHKTSRILKEYLYGY